MVGYGQHLSEWRLAIACGSLKMLRFFFCRFAKGCSFPTCWPRSHYVTGMNTKRGTSDCQEEPAPPRVEFNLAETQKFHGLLLIIRKKVSFCYGPNANWKIREEMKTFMSLLSLSLSLAVKIKNGNFNLEARKKCRTTGFAFLWWIKKYFQRKQSEMTNVSGVLTPEPFPPPLWNL